MIKMNLFDPELNTEFNTFLEQYQVEKILVPPNEKSSILSEANARVCRFCKRRSPQVKFEKEAHLIPHQLGNKYLVSDFECDSCNKIFGIYEAQLANYLGISRTLSKTEGRSGIPKFLSPMIGEGDIVQFPNLLEEK